MPRGAPRARRYFRRCGSARADVSMHARDDRPAPSVAWSWKCVCARGVPGVFSVLQRRDGPPSRRAAPAARGAHVRTPARRASQRVYCTHIERVLHVDTLPESVKPAECLLRSEEQHVMQRGVLPEAQAAPGAGPAASRHRRSLQPIRTSEGRRASAICCSPCAGHSDPRRPESRARSSICAAASPRSRA